MDNFSWPDPPNQVAFPIAKPGYPVIFASAFTTAVFAMLGFSTLALICLVFTFFSCFFFRDPDRVVPKNEKAIVSPADGKVIIADIVENNPYCEGQCLKVSIFMSVFNVHVNRIPYDGEVTDIFYNPGKFVSANLDKASKSNEQNAVFLRTEDGEKICFVQIAGFIARRIICGVQKGDKVKKGQRFGMICFGSRLDVYLPTDSELEVSVGDKVHAGSTILGKRP